eukprot:GHVH01004280.1.p1 GENE.GHVH01004280.1~~GHVH01004280.1.p1  ORF type:complete len:325 (+),score=28.99 GHVH01004280.1:56-1030(+)
MKSSITSSTSSYSVVPDDKPHSKNDNDEAPRARRRKSRSESSFKPVSSSEMIGSYSYYSDSEVRLVPFPGYPAFLNTTDCLDSKPSRTWCHANLLDHGECKKDDQLLTARRSGQVTSRTVVSSANPDANSKLTLSKPGSKSLESIHSISNASEQVVVKSRSNSRSISSHTSASGSHASGKSDVIETPRMGKGRFSNIHHNGYWVNDLDFDYKPVDVAADAFGGGGGSDEILEGEETPRSPRNIYKREHALMGKPANGYILGGRIPPPMPDSSRGNPYQHQRVNKARFDDVRRNKKTQEDRENDKKEALIIHDHILHKASGETLI